MQRSYRQFQMERALPGLEARVTKLEVRPAALAGVRTQANHRGPPLPAPLSLPPLVPPQPHVPLLVPPQPHVPPLVPPPPHVPPHVPPLVPPPPHVPPHVPPLVPPPPHALPQAERDAISIEQEDKVREFLALRCAPCVRPAVFHGFVATVGKFDRCARQQHQVREFLALRCGPCVCLRCDCGQGRLLWLLSRKAALSSCWRSGAIHGLRWWLVRCNCGEAGIDRRTKCGSCWASGACCVAGQMLWQTC